MNESILNALMHLFAIIVDEQKVGFEIAAREVVSRYLERQFNRQWLTRYLDNFEEYLEESHLKTGDNNSSKLKHQQIKTVCEKLVVDMEQEQKVWLMLQLLEFITDSEFVDTEELEYVKTVANTFNISGEEYENGRQFILGNEFQIPFNKNLLLIDSNANFNHEVVKHIYNSRLRGRLFILHLESTNTFIVKYFGEHNLFLNGHNVKLNRSYMFSFGSVLRSSRIEPVYYSQVASMFMGKKDNFKIHFIAKDIEFNFRGSKDGLHPFTFAAESGQLIGVMGGSGTGKSTLLNILNGNLPLTKGKITINGCDLHADKEKLEGLIGYVPQDDLLVEELTVYENLYYNAKLCFSQFSKEKIELLIDEVLEMFDLVEARDLKVGDPLNKILSGGQRKRLNIALELMREPAILFVDEPTSGLSSSDSEKVMTLLKRMVLKGKLVMCNIHQPSSDIFKMLDKLIILDQGGRVIYYGNPVDAVVYFKTQSHYVKADESECLSCGNVNTEQILKIIETRMMNEYGKQIRKRKRTPEEWYSAYKREIESVTPLPRIKQRLQIPKNYFQIPARAKQLRIYLERDIKAKFSNKQYLLITLLEAPLLAVILGFFTKNVSGEDENHLTYIFANNANIPSYLFMAVVVALFLGLICSAEEIIHDRRIMKRESFLNLSRFSYLNAKVIIMFGISAIQTLLFVLIANYILEINGLTLQYWAVLFTASCCANLIGLNLSVALNSVVAVYVSIPFILVPQLLFSGVIVDFNNLHPAITNQKQVPIVGDLMTSRWAYEALMVEQFRNNKFERNFFAFEQEMSNAAYTSSFHIPELERRVVLHKHLKDSTSLAKNIKLINHELNDLSDSVLFKPGLNEASVLLELDYQKRLAWRDYKFYSGLKDKKYQDLEKELGSYKALSKFRNDNYNDAVANVVLNKIEIKKIKTYNGVLISNKDPIYRFPNAKNGRAHFYAPVKRLGNWYIDTIWFNIMFIWLTNVWFYITLYTDMLRRTLGILEAIWLRIIPHGEFLRKKKRQS